MEKTIGDPFHYRAVNFALTNLNDLFYNSILPALKELFKTVMKVNYRVLI